MMDREHFDGGPLTFAAAENERLLARLRVLVVMLLMIIPTSRVIAFGFSDPIYNWSFFLNSGALVCAVAVLWLLRVSSFERWHGRATVVFDVTLVSVVLTTFAVVGGHQSGMLNRNTFPVYLIALVAAGLRLDRTACLLGGLAAMVGWSVVIWVSLAQPSAAGLDPGDVQLLLLDQTNRFMVLVVATILALAIVRVGRRLVELASLDGLTGTLNRSAFEIVLRRELLSAKRHGHRIALARVDLDGLKAFNDRHGHARGDEALRHVARLLGRSLRRSDVVARHGGDEFAVLMPQAGSADALKRIDELRAALAEAPLLFGGTQAPVRVTAGVASCPDDGTEELTLLDVADSRLLAGKRAGRDRVVGP